MARSGGRDTGQTCSNRKGWRKGWRHLRSLLIYLGDHNFTLEMFYRLYVFLYIR